MVYSPTQLTAHHVRWHTSRPLTIQCQRELVGGAEGCAGDGDGGSG